MDASALETLETLVAQNGELLNTLVEQNTDLLTRLYVGQLFVIGSVAAAAVVFVLYKFVREFY